MHELETDHTGRELTFAKQQLGMVSTNECSKLLGMKWMKPLGTLQVDFPAKPVILTNRGILAFLAKIYDPLGLISPLSLDGKLIFRETCEAN